MSYNIQQIAGIVQGKLLSFSENTMISELLSDSRRINSPYNALFFALKSERRNGHDFVEEAYQKGVRSFVVGENRDWTFADANILLVEDTLTALQRLAAKKRGDFSGEVIGITGSNGKTIVKEWLSELLRDHYRIVKSPASYNSQIGVPLSVWQLNPRAGMGIFEAGISRPGEMASLQKIIRPSIGILTTIGDAHDSGFRSRDEKITEKLKLFTETPLIIYPRGIDGIDKQLQALPPVDNGRRTLFSWSRGGDADVSISQIERRDNDTTFTVTHKNGAFEITIPFSDEASFENAVTCICALLHFGFAGAEIAPLMKRLFPVAMRLELHEGIRNTSIINDSYSADLNSLKIALDFLSRQHQHNKRTLILTDFLQTGIPEAQLYQDIARLIGDYAIDRVIAIGPEISRNQGAFEYIPRRNGAVETIFFSAPEEFLKSFPRLTFADETILIKGARVFGLEEINRVFERQTHKTYLDINLNALLSNLKTFQQLIRPSTKIMAMVKAFSYGSGSFEIANALQFNKVDYLAVAYADEGVELRRRGISVPIMVMNPDEADFPALVNHRLEPEMYSPGLMRSFGSYLRRAGSVSFPVHIEVETGMNRLGMSLDDLEGLRALLSEGFFRVQSVFSHLVASEDPAFDAFTRQQAATFSSLADNIAGMLDYPFLRHLLNTSGVARHPDLQYDMVRIGIGLYGLGGSGKQPLTEVSTLRSSIAQIKTLAAGETVSYARSGKVTRDSRIATVRLGYADGYPRVLGNGRAQMLVNGRRAPTIGNICMDMTMLDITDAGNVREGDGVIVFGDGLPVAEVAAWAGTIPYEILTGVSQRVKRVYYQE